MTIRLDRNHLLFAFDVWWIAFFLLAKSPFGHSLLFNVISGVSLVCIPGLLTIAVLRLNSLSPWAHIGFMVGFSILELMLLGVVGNTFLPPLGISRPLGPAFLYLLSVCMTLLAGLAWWRDMSLTLSLKKYLFFDTLCDTLFAFTPVLFVALSIAGAIILNNGGSGIITLLMLIAIALYAALLMRESEHLAPEVIPTALFFVALSLLFMTSLRGWYITGHDIQREFGVFQLTKKAGLWNMAVYRDAYNACLSITVLPTIFSSTLAIADHYIYKALYQIMFAVVAPLTYLLARTTLTKRLSVFATFFFISFPTFFTDMPFLARQEIAFMFLALLLYILFALKETPAKTHLLFLAMGLGVLFSHYSTTYTLIAVFGLMWAMRPLFNWFSSALLRRSRLLESSGIALLSRELPKLSFGKIATLALMSIVWTTVITGTGGNVTHVIDETAHAVLNGFAGDNRSIDAINLLSVEKPSLTQLLADYEREVVEPLRAAEPDIFFPSETYAAYPILVREDKPLPATEVSRSLAIGSIEPRMFVPAIGSLVVKLFELLLPIGILYALLRRSRVASIDQEIFLFAGASLVFIALTVLLPVLSVEYGIYRAMQQSLFVIDMFFIIGGLALFDNLVALHKKIRFAARYSVGAMGALTLVFFLFSTGAMPQIFGGNEPLLHLNNAGSYYETFLSTRTDAAAIEHLSAVAADSIIDGTRFEIQADKYTQQKIFSLSGFPAYGDILPALVHRHTYVFLSESTVAGGTASVSQNGNRIIYVYPLPFLDENTSLVYNNGGARVYH